MTTPEGAIAVIITILVGVFGVGGAMLGMARSEERWIRKRRERR